MSKEFDYTKVQHVTSVDQSDREVPYIIIPAKYIDASPKFLLSE